jgi:hypothetical protein
VRVAEPAGDVERHVEELGGSWSAGGHYTVNGQSQKKVSAFDRASGRPLD